MKKISKKHYYFGFTLVEMLVSLFIFSIILAMSSTMLIISYQSSRTFSVKKSNINDNLDFISKVLRDKVENANDKETITDKVNITNPNNQQVTVYGADTQNPNYLFLSKDVNGTDHWCTFFTFNDNASASDNGVWMYQKKNCNEFVPFNANNNTFERLNTPDVLLTKSIISPKAGFSNGTDPSNRFMSQLDISLTFADKQETLAGRQDNNATTLQDTYNISYQVFKALTS